MPTSVTPPSAPRLFLVDGYALIYRAFFALITRPLTTSRGENTSAAWGIANFVNRLLTTHRPEYLAWVHDSGLSFRHERYPEYKATREKLTEELQSDFDTGMERICALLEAHRIPIVTLPGYEADDVIGTLARKGVQAGLNVVVVSGDKDFQQLVQPGVWLLNPGRGGPASVEEQWVGMENATERLGVPPSHVTDYLALVGDSSDNVPGVKGIGDKGAIELVSTYGTLENILERAAEITKKRPREALLAQADAARLSKELVTIRQDLDVPLDLDSMRVKDSDRLRLRALLVELEFHAMAREIEAPEPVREQAAARTNYVTVDSAEALATLVRRAREVRHIALDTEVLIDPGSPLKIDALRSTLVSLAIAVAPGEAYYLPLAHRAWQHPQGELGLGGEQQELTIAGLTDRDRGDERAQGAGGAATVDDGAPAARRTKAKAKGEPASIAGRALADQGALAVTNLPALDDPAMEPLRALLADPSVRKTMQNAKFDLLALRRAGIELAGLDFDTMIASYVLDPGRRSHGLDLLALEFLDHRLTSHEELCGKGRNEVPFDMVPVSCARDYCCEGADMAWRLREMFEPQLAGAHLDRLLCDVEMPLVDVLAQMEWTGIPIDLTWFASLKTRFESERQRVEEEIYASAGERFNINSNPKLREILFEKLELPVLKRTATGASTDASVLTQLAEQGHELPVLLMEYRELAKLESTYIDALPLLVHPETRRLHTSFNQTVAATGRLSSTEPNLQNIPIRRELGREIRRGFVPREGWLLLAADYSQIELRLLAHLSGDPAFVEAFRSGGDIHRQTAALIFEVPLDQVTGEMRARAKTINFATIYGQGAHALSRQLKIAHAEAREFIDTYFVRFAEVRRYLDESVEFARKNGYAQTLFGRRRYIPELRERNFNIRAFGERTAANSPIQGSAADLIKMAMIRIAARLRREGLHSAMLLQVHDELVFELPPEEKEALSALVREEMEHAAELSVPLVVDLGFGSNWVETKG
jgi:DNA polymerase I